MAPIPNFIQRAFSKSASACKQSSQMTEIEQLIEDEVKAAMRPVDLGYQFKIKNLAREINPNDEYVVHERMGEGAFGHVDRVKLYSSVEPHSATLKRRNNNYLAKKVFDLGKIIAPTSGEMEGFLVQTEKERQGELKKQLFDEITRIQKEIKIFSKVSSNEYIVEYLGYQLDDELKCISLFMEVCEVSVGQLLAKGFTFTPEQICATTCCALLGLQHMHSKEISVVHLDIKPDNLLIHKSGVVKICDFGVSTNSINPPSVLPPNQLRFTPAYVAPELFHIYQQINNVDKENQDADEIDTLEIEISQFFREGNAYKCDVWSLGMTLIDMLFQVTPLTFASFQTIRDKLSSCSMNAQLNLFETYLEMLLTDGGEMAQEGIVTYQNEKGDAPRLSFKRAVVDFLESYDPKTDAATQSVLDFIDNCLVIDNKKRKSVPDLLKSSFVKDPARWFDGIDVKKKVEMKEVMKKVLFEYLTAEQTKKEEKNRMETKRRKKSGLLSLLSSFRLIGSVSGNRAKAFQINSNKKNILNAPIDNLIAKNLDNPVNNIMVQPKKQRPQQDIIARNFVVDDSLLNCSL